jgi:hypothetical protein
LFKYHSVFGNDEKISGLFGDQRTPRFYVHCFVPQRIVSRLFKKALLVENYPILKSLWSIMNFPRVRSILWDATPDDDDANDATIGNFETVFTISGEQLLSSEWVWKTDVSMELVEKLRQRKSECYFLTARETWCETGNWRVFARRLCFEAVSDTPPFLKGNHEACIPLMVNESHVGFPNERKNQTQLFGGLCFCDLLNCFVPKIVVEECDKDVVLCLRIHIPDVQFVFTKISSPRIDNTDFIRQYVKDLQRNKDDGESFSMADCFGFLSMNSVRKLILYKRDDPDILERQPVVGVWLVVKSRVDPAMLWMACYHFLYVQGIYQRVLQNGSFLVLLLYTDNNNNNNDDDDSQQKYSVLCCNCEAKLGNKCLSNKPPQKAYSCYFTIPEHTMNSDITAYLGLPVKIYQLSAPMTSSLDRRKASYSFRDTSKSVENNSDASKDCSSTEGGAHDEAKQSTCFTLGTVENRKNAQQEDQTTKAQLQRLHEEMESLKKYFWRLGVAPEYKYQENAPKDGMKKLSREASKPWKNHARRPRSPSQEDISQDTVFAKAEGSTGHIMSPVSSATDGDPKNELFHHPKSSVPPIYARQPPNNPWSSKPGAPDRIDVAVQVDWRENRGSFQDYDNVIHTNQPELHSRQVDSLFKVDEQVVTTDLESHEYSHRQLEPSPMLQNNCSYRHKYSTHSSSCSSPYKGCASGAKDYTSSCIEDDNFLSGLKSQGSSHSSRSLQPRRTLVATRRKRGSSKRRQVKSTGPAEELEEDDSDLTVPKIICAGSSDYENYDDDGYSSGTAEHFSR